MTTTLNRVLDIARAALIECDERGLVPCLALYLAPPDAFAVLRDVEQFSPLYRLDTPGQLKPPVVGRVHEPGWFKAKRDSAYMGVVMGRAHVFRDNDGTPGKALLSSGVIFMDDAERSRAYRHQKAGRYGWLDDFETSLHDND